MRILGISAYYHDSAACLIEDGRIIAAAQEERFTRKKHDAGFPLQAIRYCLAEAGVKAGDQLDAVAFYDKPILKFARILETYFSTAPKGLRSFVMSMPIWLKRKLWIPLEIESELAKLKISIKEDIYFCEHHAAHAASAFYPSPFAEAAILTLDGVGEWATSTIGHGQGNDFKMLQEMRFPHSLGLLYSAFTYFCGFGVNSGEYKLMGLAPYGRPVYVKEIKKHLLDLRPDGSFRLNLDYFGYLDGLTMTNQRFADLFGGPARKAETEITQREMDLARSIQEVTEEVVLNVAQHAYSMTGCADACLAGGVALNCVANGRLLREGPFRNIWIQPAAGDAGGALGAALHTWYKAKRESRTVDDCSDSMQGAYLGPLFRDQEIEAYLVANGYPFDSVPDLHERATMVAGLIADQNVIGCFQGRMEFGPRALGNRSILGDARSPEMQSIMNLKIKYRESFRPFAPSCLKERVSDYFEMDGVSPYMLLVAKVKAERCIAGLGDGDSFLRDRIHQLRSDLPAITHVDHSARVQTVSWESNPEYYAIIKAFETLTGCGVIINTSFNVRGEPIVCTPEDAYRCFMRTEMDYLVMGSYVLSKQKQPVWPDDAAWRNDYVLD
jgi:carbamoyltransferase